MYAMDVTEEVSHARSDVKLLAFLNIASIVVAELVSH